METYKRGIREKSYGSYVNSDKTHVSVLYDSKTKTHYLQQNIYFKISKHFIPSLTYLPYDTSKLKIKVREISHLQHVT